MIPYKKTKLIVEAFNEMPDKRLIVIGSGEEFDSMNLIAKENIELLGYQEKEDMIKYVQRAKAFLYAAVEDFGIVPIEALSCGTPVIALDEGGTKETVQNRVNGVHFKTQTKEDIINAVSEFENSSFDLRKISEDTQVYSISRFKREFLEFCESCMHSHSERL